MSTSFSSMQYEASFAPKRLCNWETPAQRVKTPISKGPGGRTEIIVSANGHLLPSAQKTMTSFSTGYESITPKRWPDAQRGPVAPYGGAANMGYKGIATSYLPTSSVTLKNNPDLPTE
eukprot:6804585-Prymnesium_polylepis.1